MEAGPAPREAVEVTRRPDWPDAAAHTYRALVDHWSLLRSIGSNAEFDDEHGTVAPIFTFTGEQIAAACVRKVDRAMRIALHLYADSRTIGAAKRPKRDPALNLLGTRWSDYIRENIEWMDDDR